MRLPFKRRILFFGAVVVTCLAGGRTMAFSLTPMRLQSAAGILQIQNSLPGVARIALKVYPATNTRDGKLLPGATPLPDAEVEQLIRLRPSSFRLGSNAIRNVSYKVINANTTDRFFVCAETTQGITRLRLCSRWAPSAR